MTNLLELQLEKAVIKFTREFKNEIFLNRPNQSEFRGFYFEHDGFFGYVRPSISTTKTNGAVTYFIRSKSNILVKATPVNSMDDAFKAVADYLNVDYRV